MGYSPKTPYAAAVQAVTEEVVTKYKRCCAKTKVSRLCFVGGGDILCPLSNRRWPIFIAPGLMTYPEQMIDNGTYSLIDTGKPRLLVTCHHVWQAYLDCREKNPKTVLCLNLGERNANVAFASPERHLIDSDETLAWAVFDFEPSQIRVNATPVNHNKSWFPVHHWPIQSCHLFTRPFRLRLTRR